MMCAPGAMPLIGPRSTPNRIADERRRPAAVLDVWVPWPSASRALQVASVGQYSLTPGPVLARLLSRNAYAPISLSLHAKAASLASPDSPNSHAYVPPGWLMPGSPNDGCSGQMPVSRTPTLTPSPAF